VSIRASQGSSQTSTTPRLAVQSRCQSNVLTCPVTPSYSVLPQLSSGAPRVIREHFRPHRPGVSSTWDLLVVVPRLRGPISSGGKNVCNTAVRIHQLAFYLDQSDKGIDSSYASTRDSLSLVHRRLSVRSALPTTCFTRTEDCRRSLRAQWPHTGSRQGCMGTHSDSPRSPGCGDFNNVSHRLDQGPPTVTQDISRSTKDILCRSEQNARWVPSDLLRLFPDKVSSIGGATGRRKPAS
jgi:hypothetical protein